MGKAQSKFDPEFAAMIAIIVTVPNDNRSDSVNV
jgi:hypothetical protein